MTIIPYVSHGLEELKTRVKRRFLPRKTAEHPLLDFYKLKKLIDAQEP